MMDHVWTYVAGMLVSFALAAPIQAATRVALVIGNSKYEAVAPLDNPKNDAKLVADTLRKLGFTLVGDGAQVDLNKTRFDNSVEEFGKRLLGAEVGLFYYAGHGVQLRGTNYLVPIGANPTREADVDFQMVDIALILRQMEGSGTRLNLVILDACRNNPFGGRGLRSTESGLTQIRAPEGTLISYATQPGNVAQDGADGNSPYTKALAQTIQKRGMDIFQTFNEIGLAVKRATGGEQQPWVSSSPIDGSFSFAGSTVMVSDPIAEQRRPETDNTVAAAWEVTKDTTSPAIMEDFIRQFGSTIYGSMARARLAELHTAGLPTGRSDTGRSATDASCRQEGTLKSESDGHSTSIVFSNKRTSAVQLYWLDYSGQRKLYATMQPGQSVTQPTYVKHPWAITDTQGHCIALYLPQEQQREITIQ